MRDEGLRANVCRRRNVSGKTGTFSRASRFDPWRFHDRRRKLARI